MTRTKELLLLSLLVCNEVGYKTLHSCMVDLMRLLQLLAGVNMMWLGKAWLGGVPGLRTSVTTKQSSTVHSKLTVSGSRKIVSVLQPRSTVQLSQPYLVQFPC